MKNIYFRLIILIITFLLLAGCGNRDIPVTKNEQLLSGITPQSAAVITEGVVDMFDKPDILGTRLTQVLYNQVVKIVKTEEAWTNIVLLDGSSGWIKSKYISKNTDSVTAGSIKNRIIVTAKTIDIYTGANNTIKFKKVVLGTELYSTAKTKTGYEVLLPDDKRGWVEDGGVIAIPIEDNIIPKTSKEAFIQTIGKFEGTIFFMGGISRWGVDSPGLIYICSKINGMELPRNIEQMSNAGTEASIDNMLPGDLIFFSTDSLKKDIYDVGVYLGENKFVHSSTTRGVINDTLEDSYFKDRVCAVRRIF